MYGGKSKNPGGGSVSLNSFRRNIIFHPNKGLQPLVLSMISHNSNWNIYASKPSPCGEAGSFRHLLCLSLHQPHPENEASAGAMRWACRTGRGGVWTIHKNVISMPEREIKIVCLDETYMYFKYKLIKMKDHEARSYSNTKNRFIAVLRSAMRREAEKKIFLAIELLKPC